MPVYEYKCACGLSFDRYLPLAEYKVPQACKCGAVAERVLSRSRVVADAKGYDCPITGKWIEGNKAHRENLKKHGCRVLEPGETEAAARFRAKAETAEEKAIDSFVEAYVEKLPSQKREQLAKELAAGAEVSFERK